MAWACTRMENSLGGWFVPEIDEEGHNKQKHHCLHSTRLMVNNQRDGDDTFVGQIWETTKRSFWMASH